MKFFSILAWSCTVGLLLSPRNFKLNNSAIAASTVASNQELPQFLAANTPLKAIAKAKDNLLAQYQLEIPKVGVQKVGGSNQSSPTITNPEQSLSCTLKKWQLIGEFNNGVIYKTKGELFFEIINNSPTEQRIVLAELLFLNDRGEAMTVYNPHRDIQGEYIELKPPSKPGETRKVVNPIWYKVGAGWAEVKLKTCRWLESGDEYWEIYPEMEKNKS